MVISLLSYYLWIRFTNYDHYDLAMLTTVTNL